MRIRKVFCKSLGFQLLLLSVMGILVYNTSVYAENEEEWMPDLALREAVREELGIPADKPLTQQDVQEHLTSLEVINKGIIDLTGLEHATDLRLLGLIRNKISDLSPLSDLTGLVHLNLGTNQISDVSPLAGLVKLESLGLNDNQITDVSPLAGLINLEKLSLVSNPISDISPLAKLENLKNLEIRHTNTKGVLSTIPISKLMQFGYDETCDLEGGPISDRVESREYPSIFGAFGGGRILNLPEIDWNEARAHHDLIWSSLMFDSQTWLPTPEGLRIFLHVETAKKDRDEMLSLNPNMILIVTMKLGGADPGQYPEDWPYWLRDESGNILRQADTLLFDFTHPEVQDFMVRRAVEYAKCGLFDGIFFDTWRDDYRDRKNAHYYAYDLHEAAITLLRRIREGVDPVRDNFLIIVNTNDTKIPHSAPYVNGMFMETIGPYHRQHLTEIESTLLWGEQNLREPQINCLEGWSLTNEPLDSPKNQQRMRLFTTMSLTLSDGYVSYVAGITGDNHQHAYEIWEGHSEEHARGVPHAHLHDHHWYSFYDADIGSPVGGDETKGQLYDNREGLFIREFTNGWAVYNRSGTEQTIEFPETVSGVASGIEAKRSHTLPDLDGEIYLKSESGSEILPTADLNGDGVVNIQDLVIVANALGKTTPDLNGDGVVNILDLVIVANAFGN